MDPDENLMCHLYVGICVQIGDLIHSGRNLGQILVDAGHSELDLVAHALLWTFGCVCSRDAEDQAEQQDPEGVGTELGVHLRGTITGFTSFTPFYVSVNEV